MLSVLLPVSAQGSFMVSAHSSGIVHTSITQVCIATGSLGAAVKIVIPIQAYQLLSWKRLVLANWFWRVWTGLVRGRPL